MSTTQPRRSAEEIAKLGEEIFDRRVKPNLKPEDDGNYVAIDLETEDFEIDGNDYVAMTRLTDRRRCAQIWIVRIGKPYRLSYRMRFGQ